MKTFNLISTTILFLMLCFSVQGQNDWDWDGIDTDNGRAVIGEGVLDTDSKLKLHNKESIYTLKMNNTFNNSGEKYGIYNEIINNDNSEKAYGIYTTVQPGGKGDKYGVYTTMESGGSGKKYGMYVDMKNLRDYSIYARGTMRLYGGFHHEQNLDSDPNNTNNWSTHLGWQLGNYTRSVTPKDANGAALFKRSFILHRDGWMKKLIDTDELAFSVERVGVGGVFNVFGNGKVQIGENITTPGEYRLYVEDGILTEKVKVALPNNPNTWADYVFDEDYKLMPLQQLKSYIADNKHLPNIPSTQDLIDDGGVELMEMTKLQMEKIEELTLYMIQMNERMDKLEKENEDLKKQLKRRKK